MKYLVNSHQRRLTLVIAAAVLLLFGCGEPRARASSAAMMQRNLADIRKAIRHYRDGTGHLPHTLDELVQARYLRALPRDPVTGKADWHPIVEEPVHVDDFQMSAPPRDAGGIVDVRSAAAGTDVNGKPWSEY